MPEPSAPRYLAGGEHTLALTSGGAVYSAGACGLGWTRARDVFPALFRWRAARVPEPATAIAAGYYHSLAIAASGALYAWGCGTFTDGNFDGAIPALGQGAAAPSETTAPARVSLPRNARAVEVAAGAYHSIVRTDGGGVDTWEAMP